MVALNDRFINVTNVIKNSIIASIPKKLSDLENDLGFVTSEEFNDKIKSEVSLEIAEQMKK